MYKVLVKIKSDNFVSHNEMNRRELYDTEKKKILQGIDLEPIS